MLRHLNAGRVRINWREEEQINTFARADPLLDLHKTVRPVRINQLTVR